MRLLIIEDDPDMAHFLALVLREEGYAADVADNATDGLHLASSTEYDAIILDRILGTSRGEHVAAALRSRGSACRILMLTSLAGAREVEAGLNAGADDYLVKPFDVAELKARVRALLRRGELRTNDVLRLGDLSLDRRARTVHCAGAQLLPTSREFDVLEYLLLNAQRPIGRTELLDRVWDIHFDPGSNMVDVMIGRLRRKLLAAHASVTISAQRGLGYVLEECSTHH